MASGKSRVGCELAALLGFPFVDLDEYVEHKAGRSVAEIFAVDGEDVFRAIEAEAVRDQIIMHSLTGEDLVLALGGGTPTIFNVRQLIFGDTQSVYLRTSPEELKRRLADGAGRPLAGLERLEERIPFYEMAKYTVDTDGKTPAEVAAEISNLLCI